MDDQELVEMLEESWYWSVIDDMLSLFNEHGRDNVLRDAANLLLERENNKRIKNDTDNR